MHYVLRTFFYSLFLTLLLAAFLLDPTKAQLSDILSLLHAPHYWEVVGWFALTILGADFVFSGNYGGAAIVAAEAIFCTLKAARDKAEYKHPD